MLRGCVMEFPGIWDRYIPLWNLPITIVIRQVLLWHRIKPYMARDVELSYVGWS